MSYILDIPDIAHEQFITVQDKIKQYVEYLNSIRDALPGGVGSYVDAIIKSTFEHGAPHDATVTEIQVKLEQADEATGHVALTIEAKLFSSYHDGHIIFRYLGVQQYVISHALVWQVDEIRLTEGGKLVHEIRLDDDVRWSILCEDLQYAWEPLRWPTVEEIKSYPLISEPEILYSGDFPIGHLSLSDNNLLTGTAGRSTLIWDMLAGKVLRTFSNANYAISSPLLIDNENILVAVLRDASRTTIKMWELESGQAIGTLRTSRGHDIFKLDLAYDGTLLASISRQKIIIWDVKQKRAVRSYSAHGPAVFHPLEKSLAFGDSVGGMAVITMCDAATGQVKNVLRTDFRSIQQLTFDASGRYLACLGEDHSLGLPGLSVRSITIFDLQNERTPLQLKPAYQASSILCFAQGGYLISAGGSYPGQSDIPVGWMSIWDARDAKVLQNTVAHADAVTTIALDISGQFLVSGSADGMVKLWKLNLNSLS